MVCSTCRHTTITRTAGCPRSSSIRPPKTRRWRSFRRCPSPAESSKGTARRLVASVLVPIGVGVGLGVVSRLGDRLPGGLAWAFNLGGPWLAVAFVLGRYGRSMRDAAFCVALTLVTAVSSHYAFVRFVEQLPAQPDRN